jgi:hypothetical protein
MTVMCVSEMPYIFIEFSVLAAGWIAIYEGEFLTATPGAVTISGHIHCTRNHSAAERCSISQLHKKYSFKRAILYLLCIWFKYEIRVSTLF